MRKVTVELPEELLSSAMDYTKANLTETLRQGLQGLAAARAADRLRGYRGKLNMNLDIVKLRKDRKVE